MTDHNRDQSPEWHQLQVGCLLVHDSIDLLVWITRVNYADVEGVWKGIAQVVVKISAYRVVFPTLKVLVRFVCRWIVGREENQYRVCVIYHYRCSCSIHFKLTTSIALEVEIIEGVELILIPSSWIECELRAIGT